MRVTLRSTAVAVGMVLTTGLVLAVGLTASQAKEGETLQDALEDYALRGDWIYDDIEAGLAAGRKTGKPVLISFRCVP